MLVKVINWLTITLEPYWELYWYPFWGQALSFLRPFLTVPGHEPFIVLSEATVQPRGIWFASKFSVSYYLNNTVFYHWPADLATWVSWFRSSSLSEQIPDVLSYKALTFGTFLQTPYWCRFSFWDVICWVFTGFPNINFSWNDFYPLTLSVGSLGEIIVLYKPLYYDQTWGLWFLKTLESSDRWGVPLSKIQYRLFLQGFIIGYWFYFLLDTPWPWRMRYPLDFSNWRWFRRYINFFRTFNEVNPFFFRMTFVLITISFVFADVTSYHLWIVSFRELTFHWAALWLEFLCISLILWVPLARFAKILYARVKRNSAVLALLADFVCILFPLRRQRVLRAFQNIWQVFSFLFLLFLVYCLSPIWIPPVKAMLGGLNACILVIVRGISGLWGICSYVLTTLSVMLGATLGLEETILGSFFVERIRPYEHYFLVSSGYIFFLCRLFPIICVLFCLYATLIVWPLFQPLLIRKLMLRIPWAFVEEVPVRVRLRYGIFLLREACKRFGSR